MSRASVVVLALTLFSSAPALESAQETSKPAEVSKPEQPSSRAAQAPTLLRVQVVLARYQGDKKVASVPYTFVVTSSQAGEPAKFAKLRMGVEVPVPITSFSMPGKPDGDKSSPVTSFQYRNVGTSIDCTASERGNGHFLLHLSVDSSSVYANAPGSSPLSSTDMPLASDKPFFRSFNVSLDPVLRDGQSVQTVASTDPVTGEVVKIDVTLNVVK